jgi:hypothetical protein
VASVELRAATVRIARSQTLKRSEAQGAVTLTLVEAREAHAPPGKTPLLWRLLTTHAVTSAAEAEEIVQLYRLRWRIEQVFRALKSDGLALDDSQVADAERMLNLAAIGLAGAIRTSSSSTPGTAALVRRPTLSTPASPPPSSGCRKNSRARRRGSKIRMLPARSPSSPGLPPASAAGIATIIPPVINFDSRRFPGSRHSRRLF